MKLTIFFILLIVSQFENYYCIKNIDIAIAKVILNYYVRENLEFDIIYANTSETNKLLDQILKKVKILSTPRIITVDDKKILPRTASAIFLFDSFELFWNS